MKSSQLDSTIEIFTSKINFVDSILISDSDIQAALELTYDIDENDTLFVALANHMNGKLWSGDKKLLDGLKKKGYNKILSTQELYTDYLERRKN
jgi:predicted nucleic acid-binding protein